MTLSRVGNIVTSSLYTLELDLLYDATNYYQLQYQCIHNLMYHAGQQCGNMKLTIPELKAI